MNKKTLELLLNSNSAKIKRPTREVEIKRLSELLGEQVVFTCCALDAEKFGEIQENSLKINSRGEFENIDTSELQIFSLIEGIKDPKLKDKELMEKFASKTPKELVKRLLLPGEIASLYNIISELSGFNDDTVLEIKN